MFLCEVARRVLILAGIWILVLGPFRAEAGSPVWINRNVSGPGARAQHAMAYDSVRGVVVLFGGTGNSGTLGDTWEWDGSTWTLRATTGPSPREENAMSYDSDRGVTVLFGGYPYNTETWEWNGTAWSLRSPPASPPQRGAHAMAYDPVRRLTVLFGGGGGGGIGCRETWEYDGSVWVQRLVSGPLSCHSHAMAYDADRARMVLFGGYDGSIYGDTWEWDGNTWMQLFPAPSPSPRFRFAMAYDSARSRAVIFGGDEGPSGGPPYLGDTWEWDGATWNLRSTAGPSPRQLLAMAYDSARNTVVLFGGQDNSGNYLGDTWEYVLDCDTNGIPDPQEPGYADCNANGIMDSCDIAAGTSADCNANGAPDECEADSDGDGVINGCDGCPNDPDKTDPGICGCGVSDADSDSDGTADCNDNCPNDPDKTAPGICGCGVSDADSDNDGTADCNDNCPNDPDKVDPGVCGCGVADVDSDSDGILDCNDPCPNDPTLLSLEVDSGDLCVQPGENVIVRLGMSCLTEPVRGYQAFIQFNSGVLSFTSGSYIIPGAFNRAIITPISASSHNINLAAGIDDVAGQSPTMDDADLAVLHFTAGMTEGSTQVIFRSSDPPTRFSDADGQPLVANLLNSPTIIIDGTAPAITCPANITRGNDAGLCSAAITIADATATDTGGSGVDSIVGTRSDGLALTSPFPVGVTSITWTATDCTGNSSTCVQTVTVNDNEQPSITCPANISGINVSGGNCQAFVTVPAPTTGDNCGVATVINDHTGTSNATGTYNVGVTTVTWTVTDIHGNTRQCTHTVTVTDNEPPTITCPSNVNSPNDAGVCSAIVTVPAPMTADNCGVAGVTNNRNGTSNASGSYPVGTTAVMWTVTDASGNSAQCTHMVTVIDNEPPTIACPSNITVNVDAGRCDANVTVPIPTTGDNCGVASVINNRTGTSSASGVYPVGTTSVIWTVTDIHGNTNQCSHTVTVIDNEQPTITCPADVFANADPGMTTTFVTVPAPTTSDNCGVAGVINDYNGTSDASDTYPIGDTMVTWTVTDVNGNTRQCMHTVTVEGMNEMLVSVELSPTVSTPVTRCITFELYNCGSMTPTVVSQELTFVNGLASNVSVLVPAGTYDCVTARDRLHTLRRTDEAFHISGTQYIADFTGNPAAGGDWLVGGNLNDDEFIDILDFGSWVNQFGVSYGTGDTTCATTAPNADVSGNGTVTLGDFTFIQINFLKVSEANCCGFGGRGEFGDFGDGPLAAISVEELQRRGLSDLSRADLNADGVVDQWDIVAAMNGDAAPTTVSGNVSEHNRATLGRNRGQ